MVQITNGTIKHGRTIKTGDFENKRADVELSFTVPEGGDAHAAIQTVGEIAKHHLGRILSDTAPKAEVAAEAKEETKAPAKEKTTTKKLPPAETKAEAKPAADPSAMVEEAPIDGPKPPKAKEAAAAAEVVEDWEKTETVKEVTDKELNDATQKCQNDTKNSVAIRKAISAAVGSASPPARLIDIPQAKRQSYLDEVAKIKALA